MPLFAQEELRLAVGAAEPVVGSVTSWFDRTVNLDFDVWKQNMSNLREFTWSARVLQWLPLAGALAVARRSLPAAGLLLVWLLGYVVVKGAAEVATIESGSYWRLIMPALPSFVLLSAAVPLLVPTAMRRLGPRIAPLPARGPGWRATIAVVAVTGLVPIVWLAAASVSRVEARPDGVFVADEVIVAGIGVPSDPDVVDLDRRRERLRGTSSAGRTRRRGRRRSIASTAPRARRASRDLICETEGGQECHLRAETLVTTRELRYVDPDPPADAIYRVGVAGNWLDDESEGDVFAVSPPVVPPPAAP